jgi:hypothetical protein
MAALERWCEVTVVGSDGRMLVGCTLEGAGAPDLGAVGDVARLALLATRLGGHITLAEVCPGLRELIELVGLGVEMEGQTEGGEQSLGIQHGQEEVHPGDLPP